MLAIEAATAWNRGITCKTFKLIIKLYFSCFLFYGFLFYIKFLSKVKPLLIWGKIYAGYWGIYGLKQGNTFAEFSNSLIKLYMSCFMSYIFNFYIEKFIKGEIFVYASENICRPLRQLRPKAVETLKNNLYT